MPKRRTSPAESARLRVKQIRSGIDRPARHQRTLRALGLRYHQHEVVVPDNAATRGMLYQVRHLVRVAPEESQ